MILKIISFICPDHILYCDHPHYVQDYIQGISFRILTTLHWHIVVGGQNNIATRN